MQKCYKQDKTQNIDRLVSDRLRKRRLMMEVDLKEISDLIGVSVSEIQKYENYTDYASHYNPREKMTLSNLLYYFLKNPSTTLNSLKREILSLLKFLMK